MEKILAVLLEINVYAAVMALAVLIVRKLFAKRMNTALMLALWAVVLARFCLPFTLESPVHVEELFQSETAETIKEDTRISAQESMTDNTRAADGSDAVIPFIPAPPPSQKEDAAAAQGPVSSQTDTDARKISPYEIAFGIWLAGSAAVLGVFLFRACRLFAYARRCPVISDERIRMLVEEKKAQLGIKRTVRIKAARALYAPALYGSLRPVILMPKKYLAMNTNDLEAILAHELLHLKKQDIPMGYLWLLAKAAHWFNPFVWIAYSRYCEDVELCRDAGAAALMEDGPLRYGSALVNAARFSESSTHAAMPAASFIKKNSALKKRVLRVVEPKKRSKAMSAASILTIALAAALCFTTACQPMPETGVLENRPAAADILENGPAPADTVTKTDTEQVFEADAADIRFTQELTEENKYEIKAQIIGSDREDVPVYRVSPQPFEGGEALRERIAAAFPGYEVYADVLFTKEHCLEQLEEYKLWLERHQKGLNVITGEPVKEGEPEVGLPLAERYQVEVRPGEESSYVQPDRVENLEALIEEMEEKYEKAPYQKDVGEPDFNFKPDGYGNSEQVHLKLVRGEETLYMYIINWEGSGGTTLMIENQELKQERIYNTLSMAYYREEELKGNENFAAAKKTADALVKDIGAGYLTLDRVQTDQDPNAFRLYYTREMDGLHESMVGVYYSPTPMDTEAAETEALWGSECFMIELKDGQIVRADWGNAAVVEEEPGLEAMPWEDVLAAAKGHLANIVDPAAQAELPAMRKTYDDIVIDRIELGYEKLPVQGEEGEYRLAPAWYFYGYDRASENWKICFLTLNALDGTLIDHNRV